MRAQGQRDGDGERERARVTEREGRERRTQGRQAERERLSEESHSSLFHSSSSSAVLSAASQANADGDDGRRVFRQHSYLSDGSGRGGVAIRSRSSPRPLWLLVIFSVLSPFSECYQGHSSFPSHASCLLLLLLFLFHSFILHFYSSSDEPQPQSEITLLIEASLSVKTVSRGGRERTACVCV